jgi:hypothetical protein
MPAPLSDYSLLMTSLIFLFYNNGVKKTSSDTALFLNDSGAGSPESLTVSWQAA